jgi:chaperonin GroEL
MPFKQILLNAGYEEENVYDKVNSLSNFREGTGFDLKTESWVDMKAAGVIDPTKVVRLALENASSVAGTLLTTECVIYEKPVENKKDENQFNENLY